MLSFAAIESAIPATCRPCACEYCSNASICDESSRSFSSKREPARGVLSITVESITKCRLHKAKTNNRTPKSALRVISSTRLIYLGDERRPYRGGQVLENA